MKITSKHMGAIARHLADVLGDADTSRAEVVTAALLGDAPVYTDLGAVDTAVVSEGLRDAQVSVPAIRRGAIAALFGLVRCGAPTCNRCGRLPLALTGSTWAAVTTPTCPVDAGLYEAERVEMVRAWSDGREYPAGTTHDAARVPIDSAKIREIRGVSEVIDAAARETGATLPDVLAALVAEGRGPVDALAIVAAPFASRFIDGDAVREFAQRARGALARRAGGATPPPFPAGGEVGAPIAGNRRAIREALSGIYSSAGAARMVVGDALESLYGHDRAQSRRASYVFDGSARDLWFGIVEEAAKVDGELAAIVAVARAQYPRNPALFALSAPPAVDRAAVYSTLVRLLPAQFESVVFRLGVPSHVLPGTTAPLAERAIALVRVAERQGRLAELAAAVRSP